MTKRVKETLALRRSTMKPKPTAEVAALSDKPWEKEHAEWLHSLGYQLTGGFRKAPRPESHVVETLLGDVAISVNDGPLKNFRHFSLSLFFNFEIKGIRFHGNFTTSWKMDPALKPVMAEGQMEMAPYEVELNWKDREKLHSFVLGTTLAWVRGEGVKTMAELKDKLVQHGLAQGLI